jgi:hypothetical protein
VLLARAREEKFGILVRRNELCKCFTSPKIEYDKTNGGLQIAISISVPARNGDATLFHLHAESLGK